jgi:hypothetical protein
MASLREFARGSDRPQNDNGNHVRNNRAAEVQGPPGKNYTDEVHIDNTKDSGARRGHLS